MFRLCIDELATVTICLDDSAKTKSFLLGPNSRVTFSAEPPAEAGKKPVTEAFKVKSCSIFPADATQYAFSFIYKSRF